MTRKFYIGFFLSLLETFLFAQPSGNTSSKRQRIEPVGIMRNISDSTLLDIVQRQTFRYFWNFAHPVSGLARERDNTVRAEYYWDYINEAYDEPNLSKRWHGDGDTRHCRSRQPRLDWKGYGASPIDQDCGFFNTGRLLPRHLSAFHEWGYGKNHS